MGGLLKFESLRVLLRNNLFLLGSCKFRIAGSGHAPTAPLMLRRLRQDGGGWPAHCRSTPELDQVRAQFSACMPYRIATGVLEHLLPIDAGSETLRACTLKVGADLVDTAATNPAVAASAITLTLD